MYKNTDMIRINCLLGSSDFLGFHFPAFKHKSEETESPVTSQGKLNERLGGHWPTASLLRC